MPGRRRGSGGRRRAEQPTATRPTAPPNGGARLPARTLPPEPSRDRAAFVADLCRRFDAHLAGEPTSYDGRPTRSRLGDAAAARARGARAGRSRGARSSPTASWRRSPGGRRAARGRVVLRREPLRARHPVPSRRRGGRDRRLRRAPASSSSGACSRSRASALSSGSLADDVRAELAAIAPAAPLRPPRRDLGALPYGRDGAPPRARRGRRSTSTSLLRDRPSRVRSCSRDLRVPAEIRTYPPRAFDRATRYQLHVDGRSATLGDLAEAGRPRTTTIVPLDRPPAASSHGRAAAAPTCAARSSAAARSRARGRRTWRSARRPSRAPRSSQRRVGRRRPAPGRGARDTRPRLREGVGGDRGLPARRRSRRRRARARGAERRRRDARRGEPACQCRPREPRAHEPGRAAPARGARAASARRGS